MNIGEGPVARSTVAGITATKGKSTSPSCFTWPSSPRSSTHPGWARSLQNIGPAMVPRTIRNVSSGVDSFTIETVTCGTFVASQAIVS